MDSLPKTRAEALAVGSPRYFTGKPCKHGHIEPRQALNGACPECDREKARRRLPKFRAERKIRRKNDAAFIEKERAESRVRVRERYQRTGGEYDRKYRIENAEKVNTKNRNRLARIRNARGSHTPNDVQEILALQGKKCAYCRTDISDNYHVDHIIPVSKGGDNGRRNIQCLCPTCNVRKAASDPIDYARSLGLLL